MTATRTPIFLLKTKNTPDDSYQSYFQSPDRILNFDPIFVPVLLHVFGEAAAKELQKLVRDFKFLEQGLVESDYTNGYGGLIFTSQRAVQAFTSALEGIDGWRTSAFNTPGVPFYVVGAATGQVLRDLHIEGPEVTGEVSGNGEALAYFIRGHYNQRCLWKRWARKPPLLFIVGEQRRDAIPKILNGPNISEGEKIRVDELVMYETIQREDFQEEFLKLMNQTSPDSVIQWVVVFSPQGCRALLDGLGRLNSEGKDRGRDASRAKSTYIATIGPTTRSHLINQFECTPEACAKKPSPEGVCTAIEEYMRVSGSEISA